MNQKTDNVLFNLYFSYDDKVDRSLISSIYYDQNCDYHKSKRLLNDIVGRSPVKPLEFVFKEDDKPLDTKQQEFRILQDMFPQYHHFISTLYKQCHENIEDCLDRLLNLSRIEVPRSYDVEYNSGNGYLNLEADLTKSPKFYKDIQDDVVDDKDVSDDKNVSDDEDDEVNEHLKEYEEFESNVETLCEMFNNLDRSVILDVLCSNNNDINRSINELLCAQVNNNSKSNCNKKKEKKKKKKKKIKVENVYANNVWNGRHKLKYVSKKQNVYARISLEKLLKLVIPYKVNVDDVIKIYKECDNDGNLALSKIKYIHNQKNRIKTPVKDTSFQRVSRYNDNYENIISNIRTHEKNKAQYFRKAMKFFLKGDHDKSKEYTEKGKSEEIELKKLNSLINNKLKFEHSNYSNCNYDQIDLHGLTVKEAIQVLNEHFENCVESNVKKCRVITGKGLHSKNNNPKIKPAVRKYLSDNGYKFKLMNKNKGTFVIEFV